MSDENIINLFNRLDSIDKLYSALKNSRIALNKKNASNKNTESFVEELQKKIAKKEKELNTAKENILSEYSSMQEYINPIIVSLGRKYALADVVYGNESSSLVSQDYVDKYGEYYNEALYEELLRYCKLAYVYENNGTPEDHALKLSLMFDNAKDAIKYIKEKKSVHDACLFVIPDVKSCNFLVWKKFFQTNRNDKQFLDLLARASDLEKILNKNKATDGVEVRSREYLRNLKEKKKEIEDKNKRFKELERKDANTITDHEEAERNNLNIEIAALRLELYKMSAGIELENADLSILKACNEYYLQQSQGAYKYMLEHGLTQKDYAKFVGLERRNGSNLIPDVVIDGRHINYPDTYLMKVDVSDDMQAARAACFGKLTNCCQSLSGEAGEPCTIHGLTSPRGGFYVVCRGDINSPKIEDEVLGQCWAWLSKSNGIVFDSIEIKNFNDKELLKKFYNSLAGILVTDKGIKNVYCGAKSGISSTVGVEVPTNKNQMFDDYHDYNDSSKQLIVSDPDRLYFSSDYCTNEIKKNMGKSQISRELHRYENSMLKSEKLKEIFNFIPWGLCAEEGGFLDLMSKGLLKAHQFEIIDEIKKQLNEIGSELGINEKINDIIEAYNNFYSGRIGYDEIWRYIDQDLLDVNAINKNNETPIQILFKSKAECLREIDSLINKGADIEVQYKSGATVLLLAIKEGKLDVANALFNHGAKLDVEDKLNRSALVYALASKQKEPVEFVLNLLPSIDVNKKNAEGKPAWFFALSNLENTKNMLERGAEVNATDQAGMTALMLVSEKNSTDSIETLLRSGSDINVKDKKGKTALMYALEKKSIDAVKALLSSGADINAQDEKGKTALMYALEKKSMDAVEALLRLDADINVQDKKGKTALMYAIESRKFDLIKNKLLQPNVPCLDVKTNNGKTAVEMLLESSSVPLALVFDFIGFGAEIEKYVHVKNTKNQTILDRAIKEKNVALQKFLIEKGAVELSIIEKKILPQAINDEDFDFCMFLFEKGAGWNIRSIDKNTALMSAINSNNVEATELLIKKIKQGKEDISNKVLETTLMHAVSKSNGQMTKLLIDNGANVNACDSYQVTVLMHAVLNNNVEIVNLLLENSASININGANRNTPFMCALKNKNLDIVELLLKNGVEPNLEEIAQALQLSIMRNNMALSRLLIGKINITRSTEWHKKNKIKEVINATDNFEFLKILLEINNESLIKLMNKEKFFYLALEREETDIANFCADSLCEIHDHKKMIERLKSRPDFLPLIIKNNVLYDNDISELLFYFIRERKIENARFILNYESDVKNTKASSFSRRNESQEPLLTIAIKTKNMESVNLLLEHGFIQIEKHQLSPLTFVLEEYGRLLSDSNSNNEEDKIFFHEVICRLLEYSPNLNLVNDQQILYALALSKVDISIAIEFIKRGVDIYSAKITNSVEGDKEASTLDVIVKHDPESKNYIRQLIVEELKINPSNSEKANAFLLKNEMEIIEDDLQILRPKNKIR
ncbi:ankyrin repeat domain-containing protein [Candidatus Berkiella cookevillensis]|uniref:Ankyrin repeat domain-containing protein n=1 Tax=Candidatus Berkiella cookevillensis TaxID=437022 RepID=A0A0Q9YNX5_9GAMM|nr:ankyrin repeat domain-containing protein [Candidatus Berkiella cookevillensis]MCS5708912.1 ankyrin repeat domain-containing protein [Candidatus Berkiella cookevillensis]